MMPTLREQAAKAAIDSVKAEKPSQFTIGGSVDASGSLRAAVTYDRKWTNGWGATAYARAWWEDLSVTPHPKLESGAEVTKKF